MALLEDLDVYNISMELSQEIWEEVEKWDYYHKWGLGKQLTNAADSISANIAEGYGRFHFRENRNFCYYSRGSAFETKTLLLKAKTSNLLSQEKADSINKKLIQLLTKLNRYINSIGKNHPND